MLETLDGGVNWRTIWRSAPGAQWKPFNRLELTPTGHGYALDGGCKDGQSQPCTGGVHETTDGGRSWRETPIGAYRIATAGGRAIAVSGLEHVAIDVRTDDGRWSIRARATAVVTSSTLRGSAGDLQLGTELGGYESRDRGETWRLPRSFRYSYGQPAAYGTWVDTYRPRCVFRTEGDPLQWLGPTGLDCDSSVTFALDSRGRGAVAKQESTCRDRVSPIFTTVDRARTWKASALRIAATTVAVEGARVAVVGHVLRKDGSCAPALALSHDGLKTWTLASLPDRGCSVVSLAGRTVWLSSCGSRRAQFVSLDGGAHFTTLGGRAMSVVALGGSRALGSIYGQGLWETRDAGRTWRRIWPRLPL